jgi:hypothetical protein
MVITSGYELILGSSTDPQFSPVVFGRAANGLKCCATMPTPFRCLPPRGAPFDGEHPDIAP